MHSTGSLPRSEPPTVFQTITNQRNYCALPILLTFFALHLDHVRPVLKVLDLRLVCMEKAKRADNHGQYTRLAPGRVHQPDPRTGKLMHVSRRLHV